MKLTRKLRLKAMLRMLRRRKVQLFIKRYGIPLTILLIVGTATVYQAMQIRVDQTTYGPLLNTIAKGESHGNYNAYFGHGDNTTTRFTDMTISQVMQWQRQYVADGSPSSAVGKYQIIRPTMQKLVDRLGIDPETTKFDKPTQDRMAINLLEQRGSIAFAKKEITRETFAANLAKEWASLPKVTGDNPDASFYAGDGLNAAHISVDEVFQAIAKIKAS